MFVVEENKNYTVKMSNADFDGSYHIFIKGGKELQVGIWDVVYNDNDVVDEDKVVNILELTLKELQGLDVDYLIEQGCKILF